MNREEIIVRAKEQIDVVIEEMDYQKIHEGMKAVGWEWSVYNRTPNPEELRKVAYNILIKLSKSEKESGIERMGGFVAKKFNNVYSLEFVFDKSSPLKNLT